MSFNIGTGNNNKIECSGSKSKKSESRENRTKNEVVFLAGSYYDCAQFVSNSGFDDIGIINQQFDSMLDRYISAGKIKRESYSRFKRILANCGYESLNKDRQSFINTIATNFNHTDVNALMSRIHDSFVVMLNSSGLKLSDRSAKLLYLDFLNNLSEVLNDSEFESYVNKSTGQLGLSNVKFTVPRVIIKRSDGCMGSRDSYGSAFKYDGVD